MGPTMKVKSRTDYHDLNLNGFFRSSGSKRAESHSSRTDGRSIRAHADIKHNHMYRASVIHAGLSALVCKFVGRFQGRTAGADQEESCPSSV